MAKAKILIVDDDKDVRDSIGAILEASDYEAVTAADKNAGMEKIKAENPDLIILDVMMETWQDGFELGRDLKADPEYQKIPILMLTGVKDVTGIDFKSSARDETWNPVDGFLDKPVDPEVLLREIGRLLEKKE